MCPRPALRRRPDDGLIGRVRSALQVALAGLASCVAFAAPGAAGAATPGAAPAPAATASVPPAYSIQAIRYATVPRFPLAGLMMGAPKEDVIDIAMVVWLVRGGGHVILFDTGFHR